jgi:acyl-coenzyme A thioesterase PaaI-like protein
MIEPARAAPNPHTGADPREEVFRLSDDGFHLCRGCWAAAQCRLGIRREVAGEDGVVRYPLRCPPSQEGGTDVAHGGWIAGVFDETLGHAVLMDGVFGVMASMSVDYRHPVPIDHELIVECQIVGHEERSYVVEGHLRLECGGPVLAQARGVVVAPRPGHYRRFQAWLSSTIEACTAASDSNPPVKEVR